MRLLNVNAIDRSLSTKSAHARVALCRINTDNIHPMLVPFPLDQIELQAPLPIAVWDAQGVLLLRKGEVIRDAAHRDLLLGHAPMVDEDDLRQWTYRYTAAIDKMIRDNQRIEAIAGATRPMGIEPQRDGVERPLTERWPDVHAVLSLLLHQGEQAQDFQSRLRQIEQQIGALLASRVDDSLFLLVHLLHDRSFGYSSTHALMCAVLCHLVAETLSVDPAHRCSLLRAALTMNVGMTRLHDELSIRASGPTQAERTLIQQHALLSGRILRTHGVSDPVWLRLVECHHAQAMPSASASDMASTLAQLLELADRYVARISPRATRRALPPQRAAREMYVSANGQPPALGAAFIKTLGLYIPGSFVRLVQGELAVVVRRGRKANAPMVLTLVGRHGMPLGEPALRDTRDQGFEVASGVVHDEVKVRIHPEKLLARV